MANDLKNVFPKICLLLNITEKPFYYFCPEGNESGVTLYRIDNQDIQIFMSERICPRSLKYFNETIDLIEQQKLKLFNEQGMEVDFGSEIREGLQRTESFLRMLNSYSPEVRGAKINVN